MKKLVSLLLSLQFLLHTQTYLHKRKTHLHSMVKDSLIKTEMVITTTHPIMTAMEFQTV